MTKPSSKRKNKAKLKRKIIYGKYGIFIFLLFIAIAVWFYAKRPSPQKDDHLKKIFDILKKEGFRPNPGFSGLFLPGTLVQWREEGAADAGIVELANPLIFKTASSCFPNMRPIQKSYGLPIPSGEYSDRLVLNASGVRKWFPKLSLQDSAKMSYSLHLEKIRIHTIPKGDLSFRFSEECVKALDRQLKIGEKSDWYAIVQEAIVVSEISYEVVWHRNLSVAARTELQLRLQQKVKNTLGLETYAKIETHTANNEKTILRVSDNAVIAYKLRPISLEVVLDGGVPIKEAPNEK